MKHVLLLMSFLGMVSFCEATDYYSQGSLSPNAFSSWNTNRGGGGAQPSSFIQAGDQFIIQTAHAMVTTASWTIGGAGSFLTIESGGVLQASYPVLLTGNFQMLNGSQYYHQNAGAVTSAAGSSIFGGNEIFAANSSVEIRNWINNTTPLPAGINWGNLVFNYDQSIGGNWNQQAALTNVQGNLVFKKTGLAGQDFRMTTNTNLSLTVGGDLVIEQGALFIKDGNSAGATCIVQVNGGVTVNGGSLSLGTVDFKPNNELRLKGNLFVIGTGVVTAQTEEPLLVFNGTGAQTLLTGTTINASIKVAKGTLLKLNSAVTLGTLRSFVVAGTVIGSIYPITMGGGNFFVSGGVFTSGSKLDMKDGTCQVCQGNGTFSFSTSWCAASGDTGVINFSFDTIQFNRSVASALRIGANSSKGKLFLTNQAVVSFSGDITGPSPNRGNIDLTGNGTLSMDEASMVRGDAFFNANGGTIVVGASPGLTTSGQFGNFQITGSRNYNATGINNYEFQSSFPQFTGNGFPSNIAGTLRVNNSNPQGLVFNTAITILSGGTLDLTKGKVRTNSTLILRMNRGSNLVGGSSVSYIEGPMIKVGETAFTFPIGKSERYSPVTMKPNGAVSPTDQYTAEYFPGNPQSVYGHNVSQFINHISSVEYWLITGTAVPHLLTFRMVPYSGVTDFPTLVGSYFDGIGWLNLGGGTKTGTPSNGTFEVNANNFGPFTFASLSATTNRLSALPVDFVSFSARKDGAKAILDWSISGSLDADYFEVQQSKDNQQFYTVARVTAKALTPSYNYSSAELLPGVTYFRIKSVDKNGQILFTRVAALVRESKGIEILRSSPSLINSQTVLSIQSSMAAKGSVLLTDIQGRVVYQIPVSLVQGVTDLTTDLSGLAPGTYFWKVLSTEGGSNVLRVLKL